MTTLPISRIIVYKHGVGYFERRGAYSGERLELSFPRESMDDMLKSLVALDLGAGQVLSVDFQTPEDRASRLAKGSIHLSDQQSLLDLLRDLRGRQARLVLTERKKGEESVEGLVLGVDYEADEPLRRATVAIYQPDTRQVRALSVADLARVDLLDDAAAADLGYFLRAAQSEEERRSATLHLSPGDHDLLLGYIAPAPAWRVSYRMLFEQASGEDVAAAAEHQPSALSPQPSAFVLLQGWGIFDNQLDEDLSEVELTLVAGMPVSFRYRLYEPRTPERPLVQDEERTVGAPIMFEAAPQMMADAMMPQTLGAGMPMPAAPAAAKMMAPRQRGINAAMMEEAVQVSAGGEERGALFAYRVGHPVSVARGQSAMVPIVSTRLPARRDLLYKSVRAQAAGPHQPHPVASIRLQNETGLTLERGPVTVLAEGDYAGEAVIPFTRSGAELIVAYAVELGISVAEQASSERRIQAIHVRGDYLVIEEYDLVFRGYQITSNLDAPAEVTIEHVRMPEYDLAETRTPDETGAGFARWRVSCPAHARTTFTVGERRLISRHEQVRSLTGERLRDYLRGKLLDAETVKALEAVLNLFHQIAEAQRAIKGLEQQREAIYQQQRQIQGNLQPLGREGDEGILRQRYVASLGQLEDQLAALAAQTKELNEQIARLEDQAAKRLKRLAAPAK